MTPQTSSSKHSPPTMHKVILQSRNYFILRKENSLKKKKINHKPKVADTFIVN